VWILCTILVSGTVSSCDVGYPTQEWGNVSYDHSADGGSLAFSGLHATLPCTSCHSLSNLLPLFNPADAQDCVACHQTDYDGEHSGSGYPTDCSACHTPTVWTPADFDHDNDYFPIFSGKHQGRWNSGGCATCHTNPSDFSQFTCFTCHAHNQTKMNNDHSEVGGYVYSSPSCLSCHPSGSA
jgi:hypothetical protein